MRKSGFMGTIIMLMLMVVIGFLLKETTGDIWHYYTGPMYTVDRYVEALNDKSYQDVYKVLQKASIAEVGNKETIASYYQRVYQEEHKLFLVHKVGWRNNEYVVQYQYGNQYVEGSLAVVQENGRWRIAFPFDKVSVQIEAPNASKVYLEDELLTYEEGIGYKRTGLLPGNYMLRIEFAHNAYKDLYQLLQITEDLKVKVPYEVGNLELIGTPGLEVTLEGLTTQDSFGTTYIPDLLLGEYEVTVSHPLGYTVPITGTVEVKEGTTKVSVGKLKLSTKGEVMLETFLETFRADYEASILAHSSELIASYFGLMEQSMQRSLFEAWYVERKNVCAAEVEMTVKDVSFGSDGQIHAMLYETVLLNNIEYDDLLEEEVERQYKVTLYWRLQLDIGASQWKIASRTIEESMIAFKDNEGKLIQY